MADRAFLWVENCRSLNEKTIIEPSYGKIWWYLADQLFALAFGCGKQFICWPLAYHDKLLNLVQELLTISVGHHGCIPRVFFALKIANTIQPLLNGQPWLNSGRLGEIRGLLIFQI